MGIIIVTARCAPAGHGPNVKVASVKLMEKRQRAQLKAHINQLGMGRPSTTRRGQSPRTAAPLRTKTYGVLTAKSDFLPVINQKCFENLRRDYYNRKHAR